MIALALTGIAAQLFLDQHNAGRSRPIPSKDIAGYSGQTKVPAGLVEDLLHATIYYGMSGPPDETGIRGCRDALEFAQRAAKLIEYARTHGLHLREQAPNDAEIQRICNSGLFRFTLGGVPGRIQFSNLRPPSVAFLKLNLRSAEALIEDANRRTPHTQRDVDQFFTVTDCDFYSMASGADAQAALDEIQHGKDIRQAIWDHQDMYVDDRGTGFGTTTVSYWSDLKTRAAVQGLRIGQVSKPIEGPYVTLAIPKANLARNPFSSGEPTTSDERERLFRIVTAAERLADPLSRMPFQWTSNTASLIEDTLNKGMGYSSIAAMAPKIGLTANGDELRHRVAAKAISLMDRGDLLELAERLAIYSSGGTQTATLHELAKRLDNADIEARLGKSYAKAGDVKQAANCFAKACQMPIQSYGIAYQTPLQDRDLADLLGSSESWRIDPKDRSVLEQRLATSVAQRRKWDEARAHPQPMSAADRERQRKNQEFVAYSKQLIKAERDRELAYYRDKIAYLSDRLTQVSADAAHAPDADRAKVKALEEEIRQKRDRAVSRLNTFKKLTRG
ncbi:MAG: hypothetical protein P4L46_05580 [Fimbriimonas sp.]|nr:hypothetical protein [Fimbriimonas sp.]